MSQPPNQPADHLPAALDRVSAHYHAILTAAFDERRGQVGGVAVLLDAVVEIAQARGFPGDRITAERILQVGGQFEIGVTPTKGLAIWRNRR